MRALLISVLLLALAACSAMDNELDEITFEGGDGDTDSDASGDTCEVMFFGYLEMEGVCQPADATCEGGVNPLNPDGDCEDGVCCIGTDQCEMYAGATYCSDAECSDAGGGPFGCPDNGWCCPMI